MFSFLWKTGRPATLGLIPSKQKCWHKASRTTLESTVPGRLRSLSLCVSSHFICLAYITAQSWGLWPLFNMTPVYWERRGETGPLTHRKRTTLSQPEFSWAPEMRSGWELGLHLGSVSSLECGCSLLGSLLGLQMSRRMESKLSASQALLQRSLDPHRSGVFGSLLEDETTL